MAEEKPRFSFEVNLRITRLNALKVQDPALLTDKVLDQAWNMLSDFVIGVLDEKGLEVDDEQLREIIVELCYWVAYREMFALFVAPGWEQSWKDRLGTRKTGAKGVRQKSPYDDEWGSV
jgi:hypothetical protein